MARRYFNWKLAITLLLGLFVLGLTAYGLRQWQRTHRADRGLIAGEDAYKNCQWDIAAKHFGRYLSVVKNDVSVLLKYADSQLNIRPVQRGNIQQAINAYRIVLRQDKTNFQAATKLARLYLQLGMSGEADLIAKRQLGSSDDSKEKEKSAQQTKRNPELCRILAVALAKQRKFDEANTFLKRHIDEQPDDVLAYEILAQIAEQQPENTGNQPQYWLNKAIQNNPSSALAYINRASFFARNAEESKAEADLEKAEKLKPDDNLARLRLAREFIKFNLMDRAEKCLDLVRHDDPRDPDLWRLWYELARKSGSTEKMNSVAEQGLKALSPDAWDFMPMAAELLIRSGYYEKAEECIEKLNQKEIAPLQTAFLEGLLASNTGNLYKAVQCWRSSIEKGNDSTQIPLLLASALSRLGNQQKALQQLRNLVSRRPDMLEARLALARTLADNAAWAEAAEQARMARQISPNNLNAHLLYNQARLRLISQTTNAQNSAVLMDVEKNLEALAGSTNQPLSVKLLQIQLLMHKTNYPKAEKLINRLEQSYPSNLKVKLKKANLMVLQDKKEQAQSILSDTVKKFPQKIEPVRYLATLLTRQKEYKKCDKVINEALKRIEHPTSQRQLALMLSEVYLNNRQEKKAYSFLKALAKKLPNDIPLKRRLLKCPHVISNLQQAQKIVDEIKSLEGRNGWQWRYEQAKLWCEAPDFESYAARIIALLKENILDNPYEQTSRMLLAYTYERTGKMQLAVSTYREALERSPGNLRIIIPTVAALYKVGDYDAAEKIISRAAQQNLVSPELQKLKLRSRFRQGDLNAAGNIMEQLLVDDPNNQAVCLSLALLKIQQNRFEQASKLINKLRRQQPQSLPVIAAQVELNLRQNKSDQAIAICQQRIKDSNSASSYILRARMYLSIGEENNALQDFNRALAVEPDNTSAWIARSDFYRSTGRMHNALSDIQQAMKIDPDALNIQKRAISIFLASKNPHKMRLAEEVLSKGLDENPADTQLMLFQARLLLSKQTAPSTHKAVRILEEITEKNPENIDAWGMLGTTMLSQNNATEAIDAAMQGLIQQPENTKLLMLKARAEAEKSPFLCIPTLKMLRELEPNNVRITALLADAYLDTDKPENAITLLKKQLTSTTNPREQRRLRKELAVILYKTGNKEKAQKEFDLLYQAAPNDPEPFLAHLSLLIDAQQWSQIQQKLSHWTGEHPQDTNTPVTVAGELVQTGSKQACEIAETLLRNILHRNKDCAPALTNLAMFFLANGREKEAVIYYKRLLQIQPDNLVAINNLAWILAKQKALLLKALDLANRGLSLSPDYIDLIDTRGVIYYRLGEFEKAVRDFNRCLKLYPKRTLAAAPTHFHLGQALAKLGQQHEAAQNLKKALELNEKIGGLSHADAAKTQKLIKELSERSEI